ncbi:GSCOCG00013266001-RA-CDS [Cotesia congregata]|nr:GSCOCG00013266001-RA-CDS [Cotesia congregata]
MDRFQVSLINANSSTNNNIFWNSSNFHSLKNIKINSLNMSIRRDNSLAVRVPNNNVSIRPYSNNSLSRIQIEYFSSICTCNSDESHGIHNTSMDTLFPNNRHPILDSVDAVGYFGKVIFA